MGNNTNINRGVSLVNIVSSLNRSRSQFGGGKHELAIFRTTGKFSVYILLLINHHTGKCICRFAGIYAYCRYFIDRKW